MRYFKRTIIYSIMLVALLPAVVFADAAATYGVDIMSTFDDLQDWKGTSWKSGSGSQISIEGQPNDFPKKLDGSPSIWTGYTHYNSNDAAGNWIQDHGSANVWGGTGKSMRIEKIANGPGKGPDRLIVYYGNGTRTSGYTDVYMFYMAKIDSATYPTSLAGKVGSYVQGNTYVDFGWKYAGAAHGFISSGKHADYLQGTRWLYGWHQLHINTRRLSSDHNKVTLRMAGWYENTLAGGDVDSGITDSFGQNGTVEFPVGVWYGVEWHLKLGTPGSENGTYEMWIYDSSGNVTQIFSRNDLYLQHSKLSGDKWNKFWIGGNCNFTYSSSLASTYYIDDVIINGSRIGPKYFAQKLGSGTVDTLPPAPPISLR